LPAEYEGTSGVTSIGWSDPRADNGELLWPERFGREELEALKHSLGSYAAAGQLQQRPAPAEGGIFKRHWWRFWKRPGTELPPVSVRRVNGEIENIHAVDLPKEFDEVQQSWDMAFKDLDTSDFVCGQVWARRGANKYLLDQRKDRLDFPRTLHAVRMMTVNWPRAHAKLVEDKANGTAVIAALKNEISGLIPVNPEGGNVLASH
jgi:phage terminase large subunit-like protein